jgi:ferritin-like metal-binding protein YciE
MKVNNLDELFEIELRYAYDCEKKLVEKGLPTMMERASSPELRSALERHLNETRTHLTRIESIFPAIGAKTDTKSNDILWAAGRLLLVTNTPRLYHVFLA